MKQCKQHNIGINFIITMYTSNASNKLYRFIRIKKLYLPLYYCWWLKQLVLKLGLWLEWYDMWDDYEWHNDNIIYSMTCSKNMYTFKNCTSQIVINWPINMFAAMVSMIYAIMKILTSKGTSEKIKIN